MLDRILTVGGYTLLSRLTGFMRDIMLAAIIGAGPVADAFFVAFRLPNHFRAIFAEGAFNAAFIPAYARIRTQGGETAAKLFGDRIFTLAAGVADRAAGAGAPLHAAGHRPARARLFPRPAAVRARGRPDADHVSLSAPDHAGDAVGRHPQRAQSLCGGGGGVDPAQCVDDGDAGGGVAVSERRPRRRLGRADFGRAAGRPGRRRCVAGRRDDVVSRAHLGRRRAALLQGAGAGDGRLGRHAAGAVRRHHHRELPHHRRAVGALLCRPHRPIADRRDRHCGRHRAGAGDDAPGRRRRPRRRPLGAKPRHRIRAAAGDSLRRRLPGHSRHHHARPVHARRVHCRGCARSRHDARGLYDRSRSVRAHPQRRRAVFGARRYAHAGQGGADRHRGQHRFQDRADGLARPGRAGAGDLDRGLDQFHSGVVVRRPRRPDRRRCDAQIVADEARGGRRCFRGLPFDRVARRHISVIVDVQVPP